jgi:hypothetical protein
MITEFAAQRFAGIADETTVQRCPACGHRGLWANRVGPAANFVCPGCRRCWHLEGGLAHRVDSLLCPGCPSRAICTGLGPGLVR